MAKTAMSRPPSYMSCATLAMELDVSETQVRDLVKAGVLPRPILLSSGCVRYDWSMVQLALKSRPGSVSRAEALDPFISGADNVTQGSH